MTPVHRNLRRSLLVVTIAFGSVAAQARDDCDAPAERWQSREAVQQMAMQKGWHVQRLKIDDGCYQIRGTDAQGRTIKAKIDPETLQVLKLEQRNRKRERRRERATEGGRSAGTGAAPAPSSVPAPGTAPRDRVE